MHPMSTAPILREHARPILKEEVKAFIIARMLRGDPLPRIAALVEANFQVAIDRAQMLACWNARNTHPTQTERRPDKESMQFPADEVNECHFTRPASEVPPRVTPEVMSEPARPEATQPFSITPDPDHLAVGAGDEQTTQTGHRQNPESPQIPADTVDEPNVANRARSDALEALGVL